ncbi:DUF421 domain-containing protein [Pantoea sp. EA-12]|uniref:YetF domain-containing protein n=1 Tax=Pantoea sp. EA-12 TaxID=3043303 RepID=UPI0024B60BE5|nr:YetF domain-containing protein [Pantoea sp. EA-12]MDI9222118.1 DUF421 domain-containing protein [Pantoea sp. EA-12]
MVGFDLHKFLINDQPYTFLFEVIVRVFIAYAVVFIFLKISGRRGVQQLSLFEVVVILTLGSASGDVTFYDDVPVLPVILVFVVLLLLYRLTTWAMTKSSYISTLVEGDVVTLIADGKYVSANLDGLNISEDEFLMELRLKGAEHLGQIRLGFVEVDGQLSLYFYGDDDVVPGLSVLPNEHRPCFTRIPHDGQFACNRCGAVQHMNEGEQGPCPECGRSVWSLALDTLRT